jgi:hypothetical protein
VADRVSPQTHREWAQRNLTLADGQAEMELKGLHEFVAESNRIEGIHLVKDYEVQAHEQFLALPEITVADLEIFVNAVAAAPLRRNFGMDVRVGPHTPPAGGPEVESELKRLLAEFNAVFYDSPWEAHVAYEKLHPFMDGNGRSGRALWAWMRLREGRDPFALGFLHSAYYEALSAEAGQ